MSGSSALLTRPLRSLALTLAALTASLPGHALLIDRFSTAHPPIHDVSGGSNATSSVTGVDIVGGERDVLVGSDTWSDVTGATRFSAAAGVATASADQDGLGQVRLDYDGIGSPLDEISALSLDLTDSGSSDRFILDVTAITGRVQIIIHVGVSGGQLPPFLQAGWIEIDSIGSFEVPFSDFRLVGTAPGPSFDSAAQVALFVRVESAEAMSIDAFCTGRSGATCKPAAPLSGPSSLSLLLPALGLTVFAPRRRKSRRVVSTG